MKLLCIDPQGAALDWTWRCQQDGHDVIHVIKDAPKTLHIGEGLVPIERDFRPWLRWADLIFLADNTLYLRELDAFRRDYPKAKIIGPSDALANWELDRSIGAQILKKHGISMPSSKEFNDYDKAIAYVKKEGRRFVSKPSGDADKALSYVAKTPADLVYMLERWKKAGKLKTPFILQEFVEGTEMAVGGFFGPGGWATGWCENFEFKKLCNGDLGCATGEQGTVLRFVKTSKLARKVLEPLTETLAKAGYIGYIDINTIIDDKGNVWPLEFTTRPGWPTFNIQEALHDGDHAEWLMDLAEGRDPKNFRLGEIALGVVLSIPDYPYSHVTRKDVIGVPIYNCPPALWKHVHMCEMMMGSAPVQVANSIVTQPTPVTAGDYVLVMTATGNNVLDARDSTYRRLKRLTVPNSPMYRTDIGNRLRKQLPALQTMGFASEMAFSTPATS